MQEEDYEVMAERITYANEKILPKFEDYLIKSKLSEKPITKHCSNMQFYGDNFLLNYESINLDLGPFFIGSFLGSWFIRKTM